LDVKRVLMKASTMLLAGVPLGLLASCNKFEVAHRVEGPIHMVVDVNLRVDRQLDEFFEFEDDLPTTRPTVAVTQPTTMLPATRPATTAQK
jgi:hypothetical protein